MYCSTSAYKELSVDLKKEETKTHTSLYISGAEVEQVNFGNQHDREPVMDIIHLHYGNTSPEMILFPE